MRELLVSFLIISLTIFLLCSWKVKRLALKEKKNQYVANVYWMQRLEQILQWQLYRGGGRDSSEVIISQFSKDVAACLAFGSGVYFVNRIFYFFAWRWLVSCPVAFYIFKWLIFFHAVPKLNVLIRCRNTSMWDSRLWLELVRAAFSHSLLKCFVILNYTKQATQCFAVIKAALRVLE